MSYMKISDFCKRYGISHQAVYKKIDRERYGKLDGHIYKPPHGCMEIDDVAIEMLRPKKCLTTPYVPEQIDQMRVEIAACKESCIDHSEQLFKLSDVFAKLKDKTATQNIKLVSEFRKFVSECNARFNEITDRLTMLENTVIEKEVQP